MPTQPPLHQPSPQLNCPSKRHLGTTLPPHSQASGLWQRGLTKLDSFTTITITTTTHPSGSSICCCLWDTWATAAPGVSRCFFRAQDPLSTSVLLMAPRLSIPSGTQASKFPARVGTNFKRIYSEQPFYHLILSAEHRIRGWLKPGAPSQGLIPLTLWACTGDQFIPQVLNSVSWPGPADCKREQQTARAKFCLLSVAFP